MSRNAVFKCSMDLLFNKYHFLTLARFFIFFHQRSAKTCFSSSFSIFMFFVKQSAPATAAAVDDDDDDDDEDDE